MNILVISETLQRAVYTAKDFIKKLNCNKGISKTEVTIYPAIKEIRLKFHDENIVIRFISEVSINQQRGNRWVMMWDHEFERLNFEDVESVIAEIKSRDIK